MRLQPTFDYIKDPKRLPHIAVYLLGIVFVGFANSVDTALQLILLLLTTACYVFLISELLSIVKNKTDFKKNKSDLIVSFIASLLITVIGAFLLKADLWAYVFGITAVLVVTTQMTLMRRHQN